MSSRTLIERTHYILIRVIEDAHDLFSGTAAIRSAIRDVQEPVSARITSRSWRGDEAADENGDNILSDYALLSDIMSRSAGTAVAAETAARHARERAEMDSRHKAERKAVELAYPEPTIPASAG